MLLVKAPTARLKGLMRYSFLDENDQPTFAHDQHGRRIWGGHWMPNLITDTGMDALVTQPVRSYQAVSTQQQTWRAYLHIGTGSTEPAYSDASLDSEVQEGNSDGGFSDVYTHNDPDGGEITAEYQVTRVITLEGNQNLTEYGFSSTSGGSLNIRELFRDGEGDPITISITAGKKIRVDHKLIVTLPWGAQSQSFDILEYDIGDNLIATHSMTADCTFVAVDANNRTKLFMLALPYEHLSGGTLRKQMGVFTSAPSTSPTTSAAPTDHTNNVTIAAYTPGSHKLTMSSVFTEAQANGTLYGYVCKIASSSGQNDHDDQGYRVVFNTPATFTKADTHTLELAVELSWARG